MDNFCRLLDEAIADEEKAVLEYSRLKVIDLGVLWDTIIEGIAKDEAKHAEQLKSIKKVLCGAV